MKLKLRHVVLQDTFEVRFARLPQDVLQNRPVKPPVLEGGVQHHTVLKGKAPTSESSSDDDEDAAEELKYQQQLKALQLHVCNSKLFILFAFSE